MRKGGHRTWSDAPLPLGTVRIHGGKRRIKVNLDGPKSRQWKDYARFWWEQYRGEIPDAMRVVPLDGDPLNDLPENLALMTGGQFLLHLRRIRPRMKARNRRACSKATARFNRDMAAIRRARGEWPHKYFSPSIWPRVGFCWRRDECDGRPLRSPVWRSTEPPGGSRGGSSPAARLWRCGEANCAKNDFDDSE